MTMADIQARLTDVRRFQINPLLGMVRSTGLARDPEGTKQYLQAQLILLESDRQTLQAKVGTYQEALQDYLKEGAVAAQRTSPDRSRGTLLGGDSGVSALIPQLEGSFFDRLIEMGSKAQDAQFRQDLTERVISMGEELADKDREVRFYRETMNEIQQKSARSSRISEALKSGFQAQFDAVVEEILASLDQVNVFYETISEHNLNPSSVMYTVPVEMNTDTEWALSWVKITAVAVAYLSMILFFTCIFVVVRAGLFRSTTLPEASHP